METNSGNENKEKKIGLPSLVIAAKGFALAGSILYALGFIVTNAYYSSLGIHGFQVIKPHYFLSGFALAIPVILYIFLGALPVYNAIAQLGQRPNLGSEKHGSLAWSIFSLFSLYAKIGLRHIIAACFAGFFLFNFQAFRAVDPKIFSLLFSYFVVDYLLFRRISQAGHNRAFIVLRFFTDAVVIFIFIFYIKYPPIQILFWWFILSSLFLYTVVDVDEKRGIRKKTGVLVFTLLLLVLLGFTIFFGVLFYPIIRP